MSIPLSDLEAGIKKEPNVTVTSVDSLSERPALGRRKTTENVLKELNGTNIYDTDEDALTKVGNFLWKIHTTNVLTRYALYILPVAILLAIPLILTATVYYSDSKAGNVRLLGLFVWIEVLWFGLWACKLCAQAVPIIFQAACGLISTGIRKYSIVLTALEIPISLFFWSILAYTTTPLICRFGAAKNACAEPWLVTFKLVFRATIIIAAIFLVEKTLVQLISVNYHRKQYNDKISKSKKLIRLLDMLYDASRALFPEYCKEFEKEDAIIQGNTLTEVRAAMAKAGMRTQVFNDMGRVRDKMTAAFGAMASDITGKQVFSTTSAHAVVLEALEEEAASKALASRIWLSFVGEGKEALFRSDLLEVLGESRSDEADEIFQALDRDGNGDVSLEEMTMLVIGMGEERKNRAISMQDISHVIGVLDKMLSFVVLISIAFIYATFFSKAFAKQTAQLWTTFTGLAFAIGGTVTEFLACVIFIFIKHPYDVGDTVDINGVHLVVERISLMYSVFRYLDSDKSVQIPHNVANGLWIGNVSRSKSMKEQYNFSVCAGTSNTDILALRAELEKFVQAPENKRDFQPEMDIELLSLGDLKQLDLRVEIRHKSNFANETLRQTRRNKFMCELLSAMRRVPISAPGGSGPGLGDSANPSYSVSITDIEAASFRTKHHDEVESKRLFPTGASLATLLPEGISSAFQAPAAGIVAANSVTGRRGSAAHHVRRSGESLRMSYDSRGIAPHSQATFLQPPGLR